VIPAVDRELTHRRMGLEEEQFDVRSGSFSDKCEPAISSGRRQTVPNAESLYER
jgi:hypothetical protein